MQLKQLQNKFIQSLFSDSHRLNEKSVLTLTAVHRNTIYATHIRALRLTYPLVAQLIGEKCFSSVAKKYFHCHPSTSASLLNYGDAFADFLAGCETLQSLTYLADIAKLEWACHRLAHAENNPCCAQTFMQSQFPLLEIIALCEGKRDEELNLDLDLHSKTHYYFLHREEFTVKIQEISFCHGVNDNYNTG